MITATYKGSPQSPTDQTTETIEKDRALNLIQGCYFAEGHDCIIVQNDTNMIHITKTIFPNPAYHNFPHSIKLTGPAEEMQPIVDWIKTQ